MPRKKTYARKWRQQKLAVGTVQEIAREIAQQEDKKQMKKYVHCSYVKSDSFTNWSSASYKRALPALANWKSHTGSEQDLTTPYQILSNVGGNIDAPELKLLTQDEAGRLELRIHGIETFGVICNTSLRPMRFEARLLWIPNLNSYTNASIDYMQPRFTMFSKSGAGTGNLLRQGYNRRALGALTATGIPIKFKTLDRIVINVAAQDWTAAITGQAAGEFSAQAPLVFKKFKLAKYFKDPHKGFVRNNQDEMTNGNYCLVYWSDLPGTSTFSILATSNMQYSVKAVMHDDIPS